MKNLGGKQLLFGLLIVIVFLVGYTIWDNNRIVVVKQEIMINNLPTDLDGFTFLQISDLHEKQFGKNQKRLIKTINSLRYDAIVFTGDMLDSKKSNNYDPFYILLDGIKSKETVLFVPGNTDPLTHTLTPNGLYRKTNFILGMEKRGVNLLESIYTVDRGKSSLQFVNLELATNNLDLKMELIEEKLNQKDEPYKEFYKHRKQLFNDLLENERLDTDIVLIALTHYPVVEKRLDSITADSSYAFRNFDLIIAGHYHGGQIRIPFLGAIFIPTSYYGRNGFFPPQDRVKGLWNYKGIYQYVSTGLGSSDAIPLLKFRFFNPPEVNLIILKSY